MNMGKRLMELRLIDQAIDIIKDDIRIHKEWADYRKGGGTSGKQCGNLKHHKKWVRKYRVVLKVLKDIKKEKKHAIEVN